MTDSFDPAVAYGVSTARVPQTVVNVPLRIIEELPNINQPDLELYIRTYEASFGFEITSIDWSLESREIVLKANLDNQIWIKAILSGQWTNDREQTFELRGFALNLERKAETPLAVFVASTLWALLSLSMPFRVRIPNLNYDFDTTFELPLSEISKLLQERQIAYRLMVIEVATGITLPFPHGFIDGKDVESIAFCYHSIVDREFDWPSFKSTIPWPANEEHFSWLPKTAKPKPITFRPEPIVRPIFGINVPLGWMTGAIEKAVIDNYAEAKEKLSRLDNGIVEVKIRSANGLTRMKAIRVPQLLPNCWTKELAKLIALDDELNKLALARYFDLAASTLEGLSKEQKESVAERPHLDEEAFDI